MNRKRKSTDILAQLGEPLPLPYQTHATNIKPEPKLENSPPASQPLVYNRIRKRHNFERREPLASRHEEASAPSPETHVPLPLWRRGRGSISLLLLHESETGNGNENPANDPTILDELQQQLDLIKTLYESTDAVDADRRKFSKVSASLQQIIERKQQESIVHELGRIQRQNPELRSDNDRSSRWNLWIWVFAIVLLLTVSFLAGQFSYEYCYYFC